MKRLLCHIFGHRWLITEHVIPIVGKYLTQNDKRHPLAEHRIATLGYELWSATLFSDGEARPWSLLHPLAGCKATCERCRMEFNDIEPEATTMPNSVKKLLEPIVLVTRRQ